MQNEKTKKTKSAPKLYFVLLACVLAFVAASGVYLVIASSHQSPTVANSLHDLKIQNQKLKVQYATTAPQQTKGLCCISSLPADQGMLFMYNTPGDYRFWMKNTNIPLDMLWIGADRHIVYIAQNVQPSSYPQTYGSQVPAQYILEVNGLYTMKHNIVVGDVVEF